MTAMTLFNMVKEFHEAFEITDHLIEKPTIPPREITLMRVQSLAEEIAELAHAIGKKDKVEILDALCDIQYFLEGTWLCCGMEEYRQEFNFEMNDFILKKINSEDPELLNIAELLTLTSSLGQYMGVFKELNNVRDVLMRMQEELEIAWTISGMREIRHVAMNEVHRSNMDKLSPEGKAVRDESGRVVKPEGWQPPNLEKIVIESSQAA